MNRDPETRRHVLVGSRAIFRLMTAGRDVHALATSPAPVVAADRDDDAGRSDAAAGCEYVDDRIRLSTI
jgi:hypothetical protein